MVVVGCVKEREIESATAIHSCFFLPSRDEKKKQAMPDPPADFLADADDLEATQTAEGWAAGER
jgi:hypothetical protein